MVTNFGAESSSNPDGHTFNSSLYLLRYSIDLRFLRVFGLLAKQPIDKG